MPAPGDPVRRRPVASSWPGWTASRSATLVDGAAYLFTNEYEAALTESKTGWTADEVLERVGVRVTTLGKDGARIERAGEPPIVVACPDEERKADPTGVGDAFRAGFLAGIAWGVGHERAAQVGSLLATYVIETVGHAGVRARAAALPRAGRQGLRRRGRRATSSSTWSARVPECRTMNDEDLIGVGLDLRAGDAASRPTRSASSRCGSDGRRGRLGWWSPDPRGVLPLEGLRVAEVAAPVLPSLHGHPRPGLRRRARRVRRPGTDPDAWIGDDIVTAYATLFELGIAALASRPATSEGRLVGGLYGVSFGGLFAGESMFHRATDASKVALVAAGRDPHRGRRPRAPARLPVDDPAPDLDGCGRRLPGDVPEPAGRGAPAAAPADLRPRRKGAPLTCSARGPCDTVRRP